MQKLFTRWVDLPYPFRSVAAGRQFQCRVAMTWSAAFTWQVRQARVTADPSPSLKGPWRILNLVWSAVTSRLRSARTRP